MTTAEGLGRCPECQYEGYSYDPSCLIWCCDRCHTTETTGEKDEREARRAAVAREAAPAERVHQR